MIWFKITRKKLTLNLAKTFSLIILDKDTGMQNNYWETVSSFCCPECGHLFLDSADTCSYCDGIQVQSGEDEKSLDHCDRNIVFDYEKYLFKMAFDEGL